MVLKIDIKGVSEVKAFLKKKDRNTNNQIMKALVDSKNLMIAEVSDSIAGRKQESASVDTGRFLGSIEGRTSGFTATIISNVEYAKFLEFGTSKISPRRHFRNSLSRNRNNIIKIFSSRIKRI